MNRIERKVAAARRRMMLARFGRRLSVVLFAALVVATVAIAVPALVVLEIDFYRWAALWLSGAVLVAVTAAVAHVLITAPSLAEVAAEVDRRFDLRERLSSSLTLTAAERNSEFGIALLSDAEQRADQLVVADRFALRPSKLGWLPVAVVPVLALMLLLVDPAQESVAGSRNQVDPAETKQIQTVARQLKEQIQQQRRKAEAEGLKDATELYEKMAAKLDQIMQRPALDRKDAMIAMNDLKKQIEQRRDDLGSSQEMRKALSQLDGIKSGPAEDVLKAIAKGDFDQAKERINDLAEKLRTGNLSESEKEQLNKQVDQMQTALRQAAAEHEQQKRELQQQIDQARQEGRGNEAAQLQQQMNRLQQKDAQMQKLGQMAQAMEQAAQAMAGDDAEAAADALDQMSDQLGEMADELSELEDLESALGNLDQSKQQMRCQQCQGGGCQGCQGQFGQRQGSGQQGGSSAGLGAGQGDQPPSDDESNSYESQVRGEVKRGQAIIAGEADGPNRKGVTRQDLEAAIDEAISQESDPAENQQLPRTEREHTQQYFEQLRQR